MSCSFFTIVGGICAGICGGDECTSSSTSVTPLKQCNKHTKHHNKSLKFSGVETEVQLYFGKNAFFQKPTNLLEMAVCPVHRARFSIKVFFAPSRRLVRVTLRQLWKEAALEKVYMYANP